MQRNKMMVMTGELDQTIKLINRSRNKMKMIHGLATVKKTNPLDLVGADNQMFKSKKKFSRRTNHNKTNKIVGLMLVKRNSLKEGIQRDKKVPKS